MENHRRNLFFLALVEANWGLAFGLSAAHILLPVFLRELGATVLVISSIPMIVSVGYTLPQFLTPYFTAHLAEKKRLVILWHLIPSAAWLPVPLYFFFVRTGPPFSRADIAVFLAFFAVSSGLIGFLIPLWLNFVSRTTHAGRWGEATGTLFSVQMFFASAGSFLASFLLVHGQGFPKNYALCFLLTAFGMVAGAFFFWGVREVPHPKPPPRRPFREYLTEFFQVLGREPRLRRYLAARACIQVYPALVSFYAVYAVDSFGASGGDAARLSGVFLATQMVTCYAAGRLGDRVGHMRIIVAGNAALLAGMGIIFFAGAMWHFYVASVLGGVFLSTFIVSHVNWLLRFAPEGEDNTLILSVPSVLMTPAMVVCPLFLGWLVDAVSYQAALLVAMASVGAGIFLAASVARGEGRARPSA